MSVLDLSRACGVKYSTLKSFMNGTTEELRRDHIVLIANTFRLTYRKFCDNEAFDRIDVVKYFEEMDKKDENYEENARFLPGIDPNYDEWMRKTVNRH